MAISSRLGKRKGDDFPTWGSKKPRSSGKRNTNYSTQSGVAKSFGFRSRRLDPVTYRNKLWDATIMKPHFRSVAASNSTLSTTASPLTSTLASYQALDNGLSVFWQPGGGAIDVDTGGTVGVVDGDVILRGGTVGIRIQNSDTSLVTPGDAVHYEVFLVKGAKNATTGTLPATVPVGWDPTVVQEFHNLVGTVRMNKKFMLRPGESMTIEERLTIQKIDQYAWSTLNSRWFWLVTASNANDTSVDGSSVTRYFNVSFTGDFTS